MWGTVGANNLAASATAVLAPDDKATCDIVERRGLRKERSVNPTLDPAKFEVTIPDGLS